MRAVGLQPTRQVSRHPVQDPLSKDRVGLNILIAAIPVNLLLNRSDVVKYLKVAFAGLARMELVDILLIQHQALEVKQLGGRATRAELLHVEVYLILFELLHVAEGGGELLDRRVYVDGAKDQHSVFVGGAEDLGHDLTLLDLLDFTIGQPGVVLEKGARLRLAGNRPHSQAQTEKSR